MNRINAAWLLLFGLCLISCAREQSTQGSNEKTVPPPPAEVTPRPAALLPARGDVPGWAISQKERIFGPENLWQFIDGAADRYLTYGFEELAASEYAREVAGQRVRIEIYRMSNPLNAYGMYTQERSPDCQFLKVGNEGYSTASTLNFWAGSYYVKITAYEEKDEVVREMGRLADAMAAKVKAPGGEPVEVGYFPKANQLPHTMAYVPKNVLGQSYLHNGFEAKYRADGIECRMILMALESPEAAQRAMVRYRQFLSSGGRVVKDLSVPGQGGFAGKESSYGNIIAVRSGRNVAMVLGAVSEDEGKKLITELVDNIR